MDKKILEKSAELTRKLLGSITLNDIEELKEETLSDEEYKARASDCELFYKKYLEKVLKLFIQKQLEEIGQRAVSEGQMVFGRGTINGLFLIKEWFDEQVSVSLSKFQPEEKGEFGEI